MQIEGEFRIVSFGRDGSMTNLFCASEHVARWSVSHYNYNIVVRSNVLTCA